MLSSFAVAYFSGMAASVIAAPSVESDSVSNPLPRATVKKIRSAIVGTWASNEETKAIGSSEELSTIVSKKEWEIKVLEIIKDPYRLEKLKIILGTPKLQKKQAFIGATYQLIFLDQNGRIVAAASFFLAPKVGYVLNLSPNAFEKDGRYYHGWGTQRVPGNWGSTIDYRNYVIPFVNWNEAIGYTPGR